MLEVHDASMGEVERFERKGRIGHVLESRCIVGKEEVGICGENLTGPRDVQLGLDLGLEVRYCGVGVLKIHSLQAISGANSKKLRGKGS